MGQRNATGWHSAMLEPMITKQSVCSRLRGYSVAAPRPSRVPRPGTLELCHILAWFSMGWTPRPLQNFWKTLLYSPLRAALPIAKIAGVVFTVLLHGSILMLVS